MNLGDQQRFYLKFVIVNRGLKRSTFYQITMHEGVSLVNILERIYVYLNSRVRTVCAPQGSVCQSAGAAVCQNPHDDTGAFFGQRCSL